ncbi:DUF4440 domain-containing protein [Pseudohongiella sp.]|uniref:nuclear transport factor 2 family protein n=1 Tax=Pseudohongiella sp. TaxID=1979412 RepID=UPI00349FDDE8
MDEIVKLEKELHDPSVRKNRSRLDVLLHASFIEIGRSGEIYDKDRILSSLDTDATHKTWSQDFRYQLISDGLVLLTYRSAHVGPCNSLSRFSRSSSLWERTEEGWKLRYHQGTPTSAFERGAT